ncbi:hypothetical protein RM545_16345 [Zunongwangia sp. F260]|uniref:Uncharacterized protein n=1 Tax=Autumnicola lenta TaxID=3075593 RepID=A0ABU3CPI1_9FLAO|nr:hypothetical protein [Zunongwangia sp. F260]MDT0648264.1 hypothetical protein [Zunongwangia sp. F260]
MNNFSDIKKQWQRREVSLEPETGVKDIIKKSKYLQKKQRIGQVVLSVTVAILVLFFFYISAYKNSEVFHGLGIMIGSLVIRICLEYFSRTKLKKLPSYRNMNYYNQQLISYYQNRKYLHSLITPLLFAAYVAGFLMLLPSFKEGLSPGFYTYILFSSGFVFLFLAVFIAIQIREELRILKDLKEEIKSIDPA